MVREEGWCWNPNGYFQKVTSINGKDVKIDDIFIDPPYIFYSDREYSISAA